MHDGWSNVIKEGRVCSLPADWHASLQSGLVVDPDPRKMKKDMLLVNRW